MKRRNSGLKQNKNMISDNRGTTMLETLVAFVVLMVILGVLYNIIAFCSELKMSATDMNTSMQEFSVEIYNKKDSSFVEKNQLVTRVDNNTKKPLFYLGLSEETKEHKNENGCAQAIANNQTTLSLYNLNAETYVYKTTGEGSARTITPKAMRYVHKHDWK